MCWECVGDVLGVFGECVEDVLGGVFGMNWGCVWKCVS